MIRSVFQFEHQLKGNNPFEKYLVWFFIFVYAGVNLYFGLNETSAWATEDTSAYLNSVNAFGEPRGFISEWNRPLFMLIMTPLSYLGTNGIVFFMVVLSSAAAYFLYKGLRAQHTANSYMIVPFLLFQSYLFTLGRTAETELIAILLISLGFYFLAKKNWLLFGLVGGLLPLLRIELSFLLVFWGWFLLKETQYKHLLLLALPTLLLFIMSWIIKGDFLYVINESLGKDNLNNHFEGTTFSHYFHRYFYVVGPVIYLFFIVGLIDLINRVKLDFFVFWQLVGGVSLYVLYSWKVSTGNTAGFLSNLIPLAPLVALVALEGYNFVWESFAAFAKSKKSLIDFDKETIHPKPFKTLTPEAYADISTAEHATYSQQYKEWESRAEKLKQAFDQVNAQQEKRKVYHLVLTWVIVALVLLSTYFFHSFALVNNHLVYETIDYTNLYVLFALAAALLLWMVATMTSKLSHTFITVIGIIIGLGALLSISLI